MSAQPQTVFFLGATGYLGSQFLLLLNEKLPQLHVVAFLRNATPERKEQLQKVYSNISFVEGSLDKDGIIQEQVAKVDIVINCASSDHPASIKCKFTASTYLEGRKAD
jgi:nucleoside-diphosphate-sugar epimerase